MRRVRAIVVAAVVGTVMTAGAAIPAGAGVPNPNFRAQLTGDQEVPPVATDTSGTAKFHVDRQSTRLTYRLDIRDADGAFGVAGAHIHCAPAGQNGPVAAFLAQPVPGGLDGRVMVSGTLTDADVIPTACGTDIAQLVDAMRAGDTYVNVHSSANPSGEVRGQIAALG